MTMLKPRNLLLLIVPILLIVLMGIQRSGRTNYHMYDTDPEFAYMMNGLNLCNFVLPEHVMGPGTPSQVLAAATIRIVYTFRSTDDPINIDVLKNPVLYTNAMNLSVHILMILGVLFAGLLVMLGTNSLSSSLLVQLMPLSKWVLLDLNSRFMVESLAILGGTLLIAVVIIYLYKSVEDDRTWIDKYIVAFSLLIGLIASSKLVYVPIALIPFLMLNGWRRRLSYTMLSIVAFFAFSFPIIKHWVPFRDWYLINFMSSGTYGSGTKTIVDWNSFVQNFMYIFEGDWFSTITYIAATLFLILYFIPRLKLKVERDNVFGAFWGAYLTVLILTLLVSKQYKNYYLVVNYILLVPTWFFMVKIALRRNLRVPFEYANGALLLILAVVVWSNGPKWILHFRSSQVERDLKFQESLHFVAQNFDSNSTVVLIPNYYGAPFKEYGIFFGLGWCGNSKKNYYSILNQLYPNYYFHHGVNNLFNNWNVPFSYVDLLKKYGTFTLYVGDKEIENQLQAKLNGLNRQLDVERVLIKDFEALGQTFYSVTYNPQMDSINRYTCDAEQVNEELQVFENSLNQHFAGLEHLSHEFVRSGENSLALPPNSYGFTCSLSEVRLGEVYRIEVWRKHSESENVALVVQDAYNSEHYYKSVNQSVELVDDWEKLSIEIAIDAHLHNHDLKIYCWNFDSGKTIFIDDFSIERTTTSTY